MALLSGGRFTLGLGAGENLNEHVVGRGWPPANVRHEMLAEAVEIIRALFDGGYVNFARRALPGRLGEAVGPAGRAACRSRVAVSGAQSIERSRRSPTRWSPSSRSRELVRGVRRRGAARQLPQDRPAAGLLGPRPGRGGGAARTSSSAGSPAAGRSTPSCRGRRRSRPPPQFVRRRTSPRRSPAARTSTRSSRPCGRSSRPASPTSRWCRSAATPGRVPRLRRAGAAAGAARGVRQGGGRRRARRYGDKFARS